uniref:Uncharacterized protein n=1 Tax=Anguilla anguilla TaxID=7936 RepID=A0A0E9PUP2_ANGAN
MNYYVTVAAILASATHCGGCTEFEQGCTTKMLSAIS